MLGPTIKNRRGQRDVKKFPESGGFRLLVNLVKWCLAAAGLFATIVLTTIIERNGKTNIVVTSVNNLLDDLASDALTLTVIPLGALLILGIWAIVSLIRLIYLGFYIRSLETWAILGTAENLAHFAVDKIGTLEKLVSSLKDPDERWEDIKEITYSFADFYPTAFVESSDGEQRHHGLGFMLFEHAFPIKSGDGKGKERCCTKEKAAEAKAGAVKTTFLPGLDEGLGGIPWEQIPKVLADGMVDVIITPIYDLRERRRDLQFCAPIYYAHIGCYVHIDDQDFKDAGAESLTWKEVIEKLKEKFEGKISKKINYLPGDLHEKICRKYLKVSEQLKKLENINGIRDFLESLTESRVLGTPFAFVERSCMEHYLITTNQIGKVKNILQGDEYILPAAFVVKPGRETLRRLIDYRVNLIVANSQSSLMEEGKKYVSHWRDVQDPNE